MTSRVGQRPQEWRQRQALTLDTPSQPEGHVCFWGPCPWEPMCTHCPLIHCSSPRMTAGLFPLWA